MSTNQSTSYRMFRKTNAIVIISTRERPTKALVTVPTAAVAVAVAAVAVVVLVRTTVALVIVRVVMKAKLPKVRIKDMK